MPSDLDFNIEGKPARVWMEEQRQAYAAEYEAERAATEAMLSAQAAADYEQGRRHQLEDILERYHLIPRYEVHGLEPVNLGEILGRGPAF